MPRARYLLAIGLLGCGDGGAAAPDARPLVDAALGPDAAPYTCPEREIVARFVVTSTPDFGGVDGRYLDRPQPELIGTQLEMDGCRFIGPSPQLCEPACGGSEICDVHGECRGFASEIAGGTLRIGGTQPPLELEPQPGSSYYTTESYPDLYQPGDALTLELEGDVAPALSLATVGIPPLRLPTQQLTAVRHQPMLVQWVAVASPDDAELVLHMDSDHHGIPASVECVAPAAAGQLTVPAEILEPLIAAGKTGIGTYIENAWMGLRRRGFTQVEGGCAVFDAEHREFIFVETVLAD